MVPFALCSVFKAPASVAGLDDLAMMGEAFEECRSHLCVAENGRPFAEDEVGCNDDRCSSVAFADQVEQERATGLGAWEVAKLVEDQEVKAGDQIGSFTLALGARFGVELVDKIDDIEERPRRPFRMGHTRC